MGAPKVRVNQQNGNLGRVAPNEDGISLLFVTGVAVSLKFALDDLLGPFTSPKDAEALGIDAAYDVTNSCLAHQQISDFYSEAGKGTKLYVVVVADTTTMATMADKTNTTNGAKKYLQQLAGKIRLVGFSRVPDSGYTPSYSNQLDADITTAITNAQALVAEEFEQFRPISVFVEGMDWQGTVSTSLDLRDTATGPNANRVSLVISQDTDVANDTNNAQPAYACLGKALGRSAGIQVHRNIGRVKDGPVSEIINAGYSSNAAVNTLTDTEIDALNDKGYIFLKTHSGKSGFYFNDDHCACPLTDDYAFVSLGRPADKATRIARQVYLDEILDNVDVDPDSGKLAASTCKHFEQLIEDKINQLMVSQGELSGVDAICDADQNILATDEVDIELDLVPKGTARQIVVKQSYATKI